MVNISLAQQCRCGTLLGCRGGCSTGNTILRSAAFQSRPVLCRSSFVVGIIVSVFAHESGHALMARRLGLKPVLIKLHSGGGEAIWEGDNWTRTQDRLITIAGPCINIILGTACLAVYALFLRDASSAFQPSLGRPWLTPPPMADPPLFRALN
ncbi:M50 family metallopeptidase [Sinorhizobium fredii]|uniref:M50 family metallopeptidase n=1 Tax=Rhizobium fredii TaxID=380 RepID=UPI0009B6FC5D